MRPYARVAPRDRRRNAFSIMWPRGTQARRPLGGLYWGWRKRGLGQTWGIFPRLVDGFSARPRERRKRKQKEAPEKDAPKDAKLRMDQGGGEEEAVEEGSHARCTPHAREGAKRRPIKRNQTKSTMSPSASDAIPSVFARLFCFCCCFFGIFCRAAPQVSSTGTLLPWRRATTWPRFPCARHMSQARCPSSFFLFFFFVCFFFFRRSAGQVSAGVAFLITPPLLGCLCVYGELRLCRRTKQKKRKPPLARGDKAGWKK